MDQYLIYFMRLIRQEFGVRDNYRKLEAYLESAPPEVLHELELLRQKIRDGLGQAKSQAKYGRMF